MDAAQLQWVEGPKKLRAPRIDAATWAAIKPVIEEHYQTMTLNELINHVEEHYQFIATYVIRRYLCSFFYSNTRS